MKDRTYRFYTGEVLYQFGYGLTYGDCKTEKVSVRMEKEEEVIFTAEITNYKNTPTDDVFQVYVKDMDTPFAVLNPSLAAFKRVHLEAGETKVIELQIRNQAFTSVNEEGERKKFGKRFQLYGGFSQPDQRSEILTGSPCKSAILSM